MKKHYLITFLGKAETEYDTIDYKMEDGIIIDDCQFLGSRLPEYFAQHTKKPIDKVLVLGTNGSSWDLLYLMDKSAEFREARYELAELVRRNSDTLMDEEEKLKDTAHWNTLESFLHGKGWQPRVIGYGETREEQIGILKEIANIDLNEGDTITIDVTHGLRHLPMLVILIALYLREIKRIKIGNIYYGAYELWSKNKEFAAPVLDMKGLLNIADWVGALKIFDHNGDYGIFNSLLAEDKFEHTDWLEKASFSEQVLNLRGITGAVNRLRKTYTRLDSLSDSGISSLFKDSLRKRIDWCQIGQGESEEEAQCKQQNRLAWHYFDKGLYLQAAIYGVECYITRLFIQDGDFSGDAFEHSRRSPKSSEAGKLNDDFFFLTKIRNQLAHAGSSDSRKKIDNEDIQRERARKFEKQARNLLIDEATLQKKLKGLMNKLLPESYDRAL